MPDFLQPIVDGIVVEFACHAQNRSVSQALATRFKIHPETAWVNYVRVHDDIGWTFSDEDAAMLGINGNDHRRFLNEFYRGRFTAVFHADFPFRKIWPLVIAASAGTCASLAGLEKALHEEGAPEVELAIRRILLIHGIILTVGGIPLIYLGDEVGTLNDYTYRDDPAHERDSRWVHRPRTDWEKYEKRNDANTVEGRVFQGLKMLIDLRKQHEVFAGGELEIIPTENEHVLGFTRIHAGKRAVIFANFSEQPQIVSSRVIEQYAIQDKHILHGQSSISPQRYLSLEPLDFVVFG
jgi:amylosucrase